MTREKLKLGNCILEYQIGDCLELLKAMPDNYIDSICADPPYGISFMGKKWDYDVPKVEVWKECLRVLKPGGHILVACGTRTQHRMAVNIEDAGFEIRDIVSWLYGSGFPKSLNIEKAINKIDGVKFKSKPASGVGFMNENDDGYNTTKSQLEQTGDSSVNAQQWEGWGTALKPAQELWTLARKPLSEKTVAQNVLKWGTGGINVDGCRIKFQNEGEAEFLDKRSGSSKSTIWQKDTERIKIEQNKQGRFPANIILDEEAGKILDKQSGELSSGAISAVDTKKQNDIYGTFNKANINDFHANKGGASRFFYCAKSSKSERENIHPLLSQWDGEPRQPDPSRKEGNPGGDNPRNRGVHRKNNFHPTVKPVALIEYLCKLITPPGGIVLDPYLGSGTTLLACRNKGFSCVGFEITQEYEQIIRARVGFDTKTLFSFTDKETEAIT